MHDPQGVYYYYFGNTLATPSPFVLVVGVATIVLVVVLVPVLRPLLFPTVVPYPRPRHATTHAGEEAAHQVVVLAGSFNPPHHGHLDLIRYLSERYRNGRVIVVLGVNPDKTYDVTPVERARLLEDMIDACGIIQHKHVVRVEVVYGYVWRFARAAGCRVMFRGIRSWERDGREERGLLVLNTVGPLVCGPLAWPVPTVYLEGNPEYHHVSSTLVRDLCSAGTHNNNNERPDLSALVPGSLSERVAALYGGGRKREDRS